ncbi:MAG: DUF421 domain-containing protein [Flavobacteriia bacterium]|nr:DUF421 domain-containing protein [Flavobacteriia bacterium]OJX39399.1 MAG: hypothetical protein BGO87_05345 [Flavobacteriia bacterium 40-80]
MGFQKILLQGAEYEFAIEIIGRTIFMFLLILIVLRLSGRRGVRQLTLFEVAIILGLGSAAGDPMFQEDIPVIYSIIVLLSVVVLYKVITFAASHSKLVTRLMEGKEMIIVKDGTFNIEGSKASSFSQQEFFSELRNHSVEHLGQVRLALLEVDGTISILRYDKEHIKYGLPLFPTHYKKINPLEREGPYACMFCGNVKQHVSEEELPCPRCKKQDWAIALNTVYH